MASSSNPRRGPPTRPALSSSPGPSTGNTAAGNTNGPSRIEYRHLGGGFAHEQLRYYRPGGYHPVVPYDVLRSPDRNFLVMRKLGYGTYGIVWLCWDIQFMKLRAIKIMQADHSEDAYNTEVGFLGMLSESGGQVSLEEAYENHLAVPLEHFWLEGPNGRHLCLVMPVLGPTVASAKNFGDLDYLKDICAQLTGGLAFMHSKGIAHGDLHYGNILMQTSLGDLNITVDINEILPPYDSKPMFAERYGGPGPHAPREVCECFDWSLFDPQYITKDIAIIDFGQCFRSSEPPDCQTIHESLRPPEQFFDSPVSQASDLWALGCSIMRILNFGIPFDRDEREDWSTVRRWEDALGPLPQPYRAKWIAATVAAEGAAAKSRYDGIVETEPVSWSKEGLFNTKKLRLEQKGTEDIFASFLLHPTLLLILSSEQQQGQEDDSGPTDGGTRDSNGDEDSDIEYVDGVAYRVWSVPREEVDSAVSLLRSVFTYNPTDRKSAKDLLAHPFLARRTQPPPSPPPPPPSTRAHSPESTSPAATAAGTP